MRRMKVHNIAKERQSKTFGQGEIDFEFRHGVYYEPKVRNFWGSSRRK